MARLQTGSLALVMLMLACALASETGRNAVLVAAQAVKPLHVQDTNQASIVGELIECKRSDGVLTVRLRLRNTGTAAIHVDLVRARSYDEYYVTGNSKKYLILRDSEGTPLSALGDGNGNLRATIPGGGAWTWWAKYPAPPASVTKINYFTPLAPPFDDIPISDQ